MNRSAALAIGSITVLVALTACTSQSNTASENEKSACVSAVAEAAGVPADQINDMEVSATLTACTSFAEWSRAVKADPMIFGVNLVSDEEIPLYISVACFSAASTSVCKDAKAAGVID